MHFSVLADFVRELAYGENRRQKRAALYRFQPGPMSDPLALDEFKQIDGADPGYVNMTDLDRALSTLVRVIAGFIVNCDVIPRVCIGVKHGNASGAAVSIYGKPDPETVVRNMISGDPEDIFGGFIITNFPIYADLAEILRRYEVEGDKPRVLDGIIAPYVAPVALDILKRKDNRCRVFVNPALGQINLDSIDKSGEFRKVRGGVIVQDSDSFVLNLSESYIERCGPELNPQEIQDLVLAWAIGSTSNSNNTVAVKDGCLIANAVGQQSRVGSVRLLEMKAIVANHYDSLKDAVYYTNSFFPFVDAPLKLVEMGASVIFASVSPNARRWQEIKELCARNSVVLIAGPDAIVRGFNRH
ncbi:MAG: hypothetical protein ACM3KM_03255 [Acidobacteriaceae bacterium]